MNPSTKEKLPAHSPLIITIVIGSLSEILQVKLLSIPQNMQAIIIPNAPQEKPHGAVGFKESNILPKVMSNMEDHTRLSADSLKTRIAIREVATLSKFKRSDAVAPGVAFKLNIKRIGASTPPDITAMASQGISLPLICASSIKSLYLKCRSNFRRAKPMPLPRYKNEAIKIGSILVSNSLDIGALAPNRIAAKIAYSAGVNSFLNIRTHPHRLLVLSYQYTDYSIIKLTIATHQKDYTTLLVNLIKKVISFNICM